MTMKTKNLYLGALVAAASCMTVVYSEVPRTSEDIKPLTSSSIYNNVLEANSDEFTETTCDLDEPADASDQSGRARGGSEDFLEHRPQHATNMPSALATKTDQLVAKDVLPASPPAPAGEGATASRRDVEETVDVHAPSGFVVKTTKGKTESKKVEGGPEEWDAMVRKQHQIIKAVERISAEGRCTEVVPMIRGCADCCSTCSFERDCSAEAAKGDLGYQKSLALFGTTKKKTGIWTQKDKYLTEEQRTQFYCEAKPRLASCLAAATTNIPDQYKYYSTRNKNPDTMGNSWAPDPCFAFYELHPKTYAITKLYYNCACMKWRASTYWAQNNAVCPGDSFDEVVYEPGDSSALETAAREEVGAGAEPALEPVPENRGKN